MSVLERIDDELLASVRRKSKLLFETFAKFDGIEKVTGMGLMIGLKTTKPAREVAEACIKDGVLCSVAKDRIRLLPALNIDDSLLFQAMDVIRKVVR